MNRQVIGFWVGLAIVLLIVGYLTGGRRVDGPPLDPDSTSPLGTRALTELIEEFGGEVRRGGPTGDTTTVLVLADRMSDDERRDLEQWVQAGGRLVVVDPGSSLSPPLADLQTADEIARGQCSIAGLEDVDVLGGESFARYRSSGAEASCFGDGTLAHVVVERLGSGEIISIGGAVTLTNTNLGSADNAVLAVGLLAGDGLPPADARVAIVYDAAAAVGGDRTLADLVPTSVRWFGWQLMVAFAAFVWWKARRFGRVVTEPQLVEMPGSLLVRAAGELGRRAGGHADAGWRMRRDLERRLRLEHRIAPEVPLEQLISTLSQRTGADSTLLANALAGPPPINSGQLTTLVTAIDSVAATCIDQPLAIGSSS